ncbi:hypothetical protein IFM89_002920 [Coptis chinensis]|uniref:NAC-A/B domain-containing protein n=1 Tax=Coptis chinensis TaxID=261450 RepID=A0A835M4K0_9MAGN|nr:hypothetical protein IFM89_002920 [Coptis chinensis]
MWTSCTTLHHASFWTTIMQCHYVVFITNQRKLECKPPYLSQGIDPSSDVLGRIQMKYAEDDEGIKKYFASFHLHQNFPAVLSLSMILEISLMRDECGKAYENGSEIRETGGKGSMRRKKKVVHRTTTTDDKRLQSTLKRLRVNVIPAIEEVNILRMTTGHPFHNQKFKLQLLQTLGLLVELLGQRNLRDILPGSSTNWDGYLDNFEEAL